MGFRRALVVAGIDRLILAELFFAVYWSSRGPAEDAAAVFLRLFVPAAAVTFLSGGWVLKRIKS